MHRVTFYAILLAAAAAGYVSAPSWLVLAAAGALTLDDWKLWRLGRQVHAPWSSKSTTYLVTGILADLLLAALAFGAGRIARQVLGGPF